MKKIIIILLSIATNIAMAHPTSFKDSIGVMGSHDKSTSHLQVNYSLDYWQAVGVHNYSFDGESHSNFLSYNLLLKRWNADKFQANLYFGNGLGYSKESQDLSFLNFAQFDIEDRRLYFLYKYSRFGPMGEDEFDQHKLRFGFAPYEGGYTEINSWIIFEYMDTNFLDQKMTDLTPLVRLFYRNIFVEFGVSLKGETRFNYITHF